MQYCKDLPKVTHKNSHNCPLKNKLITEFQAIQDIVDILKVHCLLKSTTQYYDRFVILETDLKRGLDALQMVHTKIGKLFVPHTLWSLQWKAGCFLRKIFKPSTIFFISIDN